MGMDITFSLGDGWGHPEYTLTAECIKLNMLYLVIYGRMAQLRNPLHCSNQEIFCTEGNLHNSL